MRRADFTGSRENIDQIMKTKVEPVCLKVREQSLSESLSKADTRKKLLDSGKCLGKEERRILREWLRSHNSSNGVRDAFEQTRVSMVEFLLGMPQSDRPIGESSEVDMPYCEACGDSEQEQPA